jgi:hypothetical protein
VSASQATVAEVDAVQTGPGLEAVVADLREQLDALVVKHAVVTIAMQELLRRADLPTARELSRTVAARVASLMQAVADDDGAADAQEAATEELQGLLYALWR